ncbi:hypothetical protein B1H38_06340 [Leptospira borgpetersenii serovar Ballum]|nr:hypothetical protein B9T54_01915 [Leptospira borgpetersenii serovar Hardjo-bovis]OOV45153.1 hypothetical protein B1H38_06340 [Leptospira borgpetersenii serovar Ballum]
MKQTRPHPRFGWRGEEAGRLGRFFPIRKSYFLQVKNIVLVGTLEKYQFLILMIPKAFLICG